MDVELTGLNEAGTGQEVPEHPLEIVGQVTGSTDVGAQGPHKVRADLNIPTPPSSPFKKGLRGIFSQRILRKIDLKLHRGCFLEVFNLFSGQFAYIFRKTTSRPLSSPINPLKRAY